jgi:hypothetical protein
MLNNSTSGCNCQYIASGIHLTETIDTKEGDSYDIRYALNVKESNIALTL